MRIKIDKADQLFSQYIRLRDLECKRCHSRVVLNDKDYPISHTASHFYGRGRENTRFEPDNVDTLCMGCHRIWGSDDREGYREFKLKQLGKRRFDSLMLQANTYCKRDRKLQAIVWKEALQGSKEV